MSATRDEMARFICLKVGVFDDTSIALCKGFLHQEYNTLWDKYPWKDSHTYAFARVAAGIAVVDYPATMDRIITVRVSTGTLGTPPDELDPPTTEVPTDPDDLDALAPVPLNSYFLDPVDTTFLIESEPTIYEDRGWLLKYYEEIGNYFFPDEPTRKQIRIYPIPIWGVKLLFYGKKICPGLVNDADVITIRNIESTVMAYAMFDMLQRIRQYGKAEIKRKEAQELEQQAWALEQQQANQPRKSKTTTVAGNSLAEMTDAVCQICGLWTPDYRQVIREFIRRNYQTMYDTFLWPESLVMVRVPYTTEQVVMPDYVDKVLGVRGTNDMRMFPADAVLFLDIAPSAFDEIGDPMGYTTLTSVAVPTLPSATTRLVLASTSGVDRGRVFVRGEVLATGQIFEETVNLQGVAPSPTRNAYDVPLTIAKDVTLGDVTVNAMSASLGTGGLLGIIPANQRELKHQRLWFLPAPDSDRIPETGFFTCLVLGKRGIRPLLTEQDTPIITGVQQILIAAAAADLFRKLEKHDMANAFQQKAAGSTDVLKAKNMDQAASSPRFVPQIEPRAYVSGGVGGCSW